MTNNFCKCVQDKIADYKFEGYETEQDIVRKKIFETIRFSISTSVLIVGPRGVGKRRMVSKLLDEINNDKTTRGQYEIVKLNGYIQENDVVATRHMVNVLNRALILEDEFRGSASEYLEYIVQSLRQADASKKALIMIFEHFHIFCDREKRLLYNLLDMVNRQSAGICVIGLAKNGTCLEALHERTQSRLATTSVYLYPKASVGERLTLIKRFFTMDKPITPSKKKWNKSVEQICRSNEITEMVEDLLETDKSEDFFIQFLYHTLLYVEENHALSTDAFKNAYSDFHFDNLNLDDRLKNLTTLELCLVIAIFHRCSNQQSYTFNFEMIYGCYRTVTQKASGNLPAVDRTLAMKAFQNLVRLNFIKSKEATYSNSTPIEYVAHELLIPSEKINERIGKLQNMPVELQQWIRNSLHTQ